MVDMDIGLITIQIKCGVVTRVCRVVDADEGAKAFSDWVKLIFRSKSRQEAIDVVDAAMMLLMNYLLVFLLAFCFLQTP